MWHYFFLPTTGIGVQGLADAFILLRHPFDSPEAQLLNRQIFETIYFAALTASCELAERYGPYETYEGSPVSKGVSGISSFIITSQEHTINCACLLCKKTCWHKSEVE